VRAVGHGYMGAPTGKRRARSVQALSVTPGLLLFVDADRCQPPRHALLGLRDQRDPGSDAP